MCQLWHGVVCHGYSKVYFVVISCCALDADGRVAFSGTLLLLMLSLLFAASAKNTSAAAIEVLLV